MHGKVSPSQLQQAFAAVRHRTDIGFREAQNVLQDPILMPLYRDSMAQLTKLIEVTDLNDPPADYEPYYHCLQILNGMEQTYARAQGPTRYMAAMQARCSEGICKQQYFAQAARHAGILFFVRHARSLIEQVPESDIPHHITDVFEPMPEFAAVTLRVGLQARSGEWTETPMESVSPLRRAAIEEALQVAGLGMHCDRVLMKK